MPQMVTNHQNENSHSWQAPGCGGTGSSGAPPKPEHALGPPAALLNIGMDDDVVTRLHVLLTPDALPKVPFDTVIYRATESLALIHGFLPNLRTISITKVDRIEAEK
jgi:hypothetical protein